MRSTDNRQIYAVVALHHHSLFIGLAMFYLFKIRKQVKNCRTINSSNINQSIHYNVFFGAYYTGLKLLNSLGNLFIGALTAMNFLLLHELLMDSPDFHHFPEQLDRFRGARRPGDRQNIAVTILRRSVPTSPRNMPRHRQTTSTAHSSQISPPRDFIFAVSRECAYALQE